MKQLRITGVQGLTFGRHDGRTIDGFDAPFVVVHGLNESGKSTLAEFLVWTIGGPWRTFAQNTDAFRRSPDGVVFGRFLGVLDDDVIDLDSRFELKKAGTPKDLRKGVIGLHEVDPTKFADRLGSLTAADYKTIYRLYGADLGDLGSADAFSDLFSRFALGTATGGTSPRQSLDVLRRDLLAAKRDLSGLNTRRKEAERQIKEASAVPDRVAKLEEDERALAADIQESGTLEGERAVRKALFERVKAGHAHLESLQRERATLDALPVFPAAWEAAADNFASIAAIAGGLAGAARAADAADGAAVVAVATCGLERTSLAGQTLSGPERLALTNAVSSVVSAGDEVAASAADLDDAMKQLNEATAAVDDLCRALGIDNEQLSELDSVGGSLDTVDGRIQRWIEDSNKAIDARAELEAERARRANLGVTTPAQASRPALDPRLVAVGVVVVAALGIVHWAAAIVAGLVLAGVLFLGRKDTVAPAPATDNGRLAELEGKVRGADQSAAEHRALIKKSLGGLDFIVTDPDTAHGRIVGLKHLVALRLRAAAASSLVNEARKRAEAAPTALLAAESAAASLLAPRGIPMTVVNGAFDSWLLDYEEAVKSVEASRIARDKVDGLRAQFDEMIVGIRSEFAGMTPEAIVTRLSDVRDQVGTRRKAVAKVHEEQLKVTGANMDAAEVHEVLAEYPTLAELAVQIDLLDDEIAHQRARRDDLISRRTDLVRELDDLRATEVLAGLALTRGQIDEDLVEAEAKVSALELAYDVLGDVIDTYERDNQDPVVATASGLIAGVAPEWGSIIMSRNEKGEPVIERHGPEGRLGEHVISDGGRALLYLGIRLAFAAKDAERRNVSLPIICDDPLVHFDDDRQLAAVQLLSRLSSDHQVVLFTCEERTRDYAASLGAKVIAI